MKGLRKLGPQRWVWAKMVWAPVLCNLIINNLGLRVTSWASIFADDIKSFRVVKTERNCIAFSVLANAKVLGKKLLGNY